VIFASGGPFIRTSDPASAVGEEEAAVDCSPLAALCFWRSDGTTR
jgi:hypothetical protein